MSDSGSAVRDGVATVATAGTRVKLATVTGEQAARTVVVEALATNEGEIVVGGSTVVAAKGTHATPTRRGIALKAGDVVSLDVNDAAELWLDATTSGDGVNYLDLLA